MSVCTLLGFGGPGNITGTLLHMLINATAPRPASAYRFAYYRCTGTLDAGNYATNLSDTGLGGAYSVFDDGIVELPPGPCMVWETDYQYDILQEFRTGELRHTLAEPSNDVPIRGYSRCGPLFNTAYYIRTPPTFTDNLAGKSSTNAYLPGVGMAPMLAYGNINSSVVPINDGLNRNPGWYYEGYDSAGVSLAQHRLDMQNNRNLATFICGQMGPPPFAPHWTDTLGAVPFSRDSTGGTEWTTARMLDPRPAGPTTNAGWKNATANPRYQAFVDTDRENPFPVLVGYVRGDEPGGTYSHYKSGSMNRQAGRLTPEESAQNPKNNYGPHFDLSPQWNPDAWVQETDISAMPKPRGACDFTQCRWVPAGTKRDKHTTPDVQPVSRSQKLEECHTTVIEPGAGVTCFYPKLHLSDPPSGFYLKNKHSTGSPPRDDSICTEQPASGGASFGTFSAQGLFACAASEMVVAPPGNVSYRIRCYGHFASFEEQGVNAVPQRRDTSAEAMLNPFNALCDPHVRDDPENLNQTASAGVPLPRTGWPVGANNRTLCRIPPDTNSTTPENYTTPEDAARTMCCGVGNMRKSQLSQNFAESCLISASSTRSLSEAFMYGAEVGGNPAAGRKGRNCGTFYQRNISTEVYFLGEDGIQLLEASSKHGGGDLHVAIIYEEELATLANLPSEEAAGFNDSCRIVRVPFVSQDITLPRAASITADQPSETRDDDRPQVVVKYSQLDTAGEQRTRLYWLYETMPNISEFPRPEDLKCLRLIDAEYVAAECPDVSATMAGCFRGVYGNPNNPIPNAAANARYFSRLIPIVRDQLAYDEALLPMTAVGVRVSPDNKPTGLPYVALSMLLAYGTTTNQQYDAPRAPGTGMLELGNMAPPAVSPGFPQMHCAADSDTAVVELEDTWGDTNQRRLQPETQDGGPVAGAAVCSPSSGMRGNNCPDYTSDARVNVSCPGRAQSTLTPEFLGVTKNRTGILAWTGSDKAGKQQYRALAAFHTENRAAWPDYYLNRTAYYPNRADLSDSFACDCNADTFAWAFSEVTDTVQQRLLLRRTGGEVPPGTRLVVAGFSWDHQRVTSSPSLGLYLPSSRAVAVAVERDFLPRNDSDQNITERIRETYDGANMPGEATVPGLVFDGARYDELHKNENKDRYLTYHHTFRFGSCMRWPYGQVPRMDLTQAEWNESGYTAPVAGAATNMTIPVPPAYPARKCKEYGARARQCTYGAETMVGYCEPMRSGGHPPSLDDPKAIRYRHCWRDRLSSHERRDFCEAHPVAAVHLVWGFVLDVMRDFGTVCNTRTRVCLVVPGAGHYGLVGNVVEEIHRRQLDHMTVLVLPFNVSVVEMYMGADRLMTPVGYGHGLGDQLLAEGTYNLNDANANVTGTSADAEVFAVLTNLGRVDAATVPYVQQRLRDLADALLTSSTDRPGLHARICGDRSGTTFVAPGLGEAAVLRCLTKAEVFTPLTESGIRLRSTGTTIRSALDTVKGIDTPMRFTRVPRSGSPIPCTTFYVSAPGVEIGPAVYKFGPCADDGIPPYGRIPVLLSGRNVYGFTADVTVTGSKVGVLFAGDDLEVARGAGDVNVSASTVTVRGIPPGDALRRHVAYARAFGARVNATCYDNNSSVPCRIAIFPIATDTLDFTMQPAPTVFNISKYVDELGSGFMHWALQQGYDPFGDDSDDSDDEVDPVPPPVPVYTEDVTWNDPYGNWTVTAKDFADNFLTFVDCDNAGEERSEAAKREKEVRMQVEMAQFANAVNSAGVSRVPVVVLPAATFSALHTALMIEWRRMRRLGIVVHIPCSFEVGFKNEVPGAAPRVKNWTCAVTFDQHENGQQPGHSALCPGCRLVATVHETPEGAGTQSVFVDHGTAGGGGIHF
eukprot:gene6853-4299_t